MVIYCCDNKKEKQKVTNRKTNLRLSYFDRTSSAILLSPVICAVLYPTGSKISHFYKAKKLERKLQRHKIWIKQIKKIVS